MEWLVAVARKSVSHHTSFSRQHFNASNAVQSKANIVEQNTVVSILFRVDFISIHGSTATLLLPTCVVISIFVIIVVLKVSSR